MRTGRIPTPVVTAAVVLRPGASVTAEELIRHDSSVAPFGTNHVLSTPADKTPALTDDLDAYAEGIVDFVSASHKTPAGKGVLRPRAGARARST